MHIIYCWHRQVSYVVSLNTDHVLYTCIQDNCILMTRLFLFSYSLNTQFIYTICYSQVSCEGAARILPHGQPPHECCRHELSYRTTATGGECTQWYVIDCTKKYVYKSVTTYLILHSTCSLTSETAQKNMYPFGRFGRFY